MSLIELFHDGQGIIIVYPDNDAIRFHTITDCRPLFQEFRIRYDIKGQVRIATIQFFLHPCPYLLGSTYRNGRLVYHIHMVHHMYADTSRHRLHIGKVSTPIFSHRSTHSNETNICLLQRLLNIGGKVQMPQCRILQDHLLQSRLIDGNIPLLQHRNFSLVHIDTPDSISHLSKTGAGHQSHISCPYNGNLHDNPLPEIPYKISRKYAIVRSKPSSRLTVGCHPSLSFAKSMTG